MNFLGETCTPSMDHMISHWFQWGIGSRLFTRGVIYRDIGLRWLIIREGKWSQLCHDFCLLLSVLTSSQTYFWSQYRFLSISDISEETQYIKHTHIHLDFITCCIANTHGSSSQLLGPHRRHEQLSRARLSRCWWKVLVSLTQTDPEVTLPGAREILEWPFM